MAEAYNYFIFMLTVMLFYSGSVTILTYSLAGYSPNQAIMAQYNNASVDPADIQNRVEQATRSETRIPIVTEAALVFYSGNLLLDLMLNFITAIPNMIAIVIGTIIYFFGVDPSIMATVKIILIAIIMAVQLMAIVGFILSFRNKTGSVV
jgi:hypothetical protein